MTVKKRQEEKAPKNRLNADDRRGSFRGLDIIFKVPYSNTDIRIKSDTSIITVVRI